MPVKSFGEPSSKILNGDRVAVPFVGGMSVEAATAKLKDAGFNAQVIGTADSGWARGTVVYTDPSGTANRGSTIGLYTSTGVAPKPKETKKPDPTPTKPRKTKPPPNRD